MTNWQGWLSAISGPSAAIGLLFTAYELRAGRSERKDNEARQARLITIEPAETYDPLIFKFGVYNRSGAPVFDLRLDWLGYVRERGDGRVQRSMHDLKFVGRGERGLITVDEVDELQVFDSGECVWSDTEWSYPEWFDLAPDRASLDKLIARLNYGATVSFIDTNGRCWQRTNSGAPVRVTDRTHLGFLYRPRWWPWGRTVPRKELVPNRSAESMWKIEPPPGLKAKDDGL